MSDLIFRVGHRWTFVSFFGGSMAKDKIDRVTGEVVPLVAPLFMRSSYSDHAAFSDSFGLDCRDESLTQQSFKEECDINTIVRRFGLTGLLPSNIRAPTSGDFSGVSDFHSAMDALLSAQRSFAAMPADVRSRFHNNPAEFVDFCSEPKNKGELSKLGLLSADAFAAYEKERLAAEAADLEARATALGFVRPAPVKTGD